MMRKFLGACLALALSTAAASAIPVFDGTFVFQAGACEPAGKSYQAVYRPQLVSTGIRTGLVLFQYREGTGFTRANNGQFNGAGAFAAVLVTANATVAQKTGTFQITQSPATVVEGTQAVTMTGSFTPSTGCRYIFKATFLRRPGT